jgi:hypothetical protein
MYCHQVQIMTHARVDSLLFNANRVTQLVMESSAVDLRFELRSGQTKNYETGICCFSVNHAFQY